MEIAVTRTGPRNVRASLLGGSASTPLRDVNLTVSTDDHIFGNRDVTDMKVWGDLSTHVDWRLGSSEEDASWQPFRPVVRLVLSAGSGDKEVGVRLRNSGGVESDAAATTIALTSTERHVSVLSVWPPMGWARHGGRMPMVAWSASHAFVEYDVMAAPYPLASREECVTIESASGSWSAGQVVTTTINDLTVWDGFQYGALSNGNRAVRVFARSGQDWFSERY